MCKILEGLWGIFFKRLSCACARVVGAWIAGARAELESGEGNCCGRETREGSTEEEDLRTDRTWVWQGDGVLPDWLAFPCLVWLPEGAGYPEAGAAEEVG